MSLDTVLGAIFSDDEELELGVGLNFKDPLHAELNEATGRIDVTSSAGPGTGGGHVIEEEGSPLTQRDHLNFTGNLVSAADAGGKTVVTISGATTAYADAGDAAVAAAIPLAGGAPGAINLAGVAASAGADPDFSRQDHGHSLTGTLPATNGGTGATSLDAATLAVAANVLKVPSQIGPRGASNVRVDMLPSTDVRGTLTTGNSATFDVAIAAGSIYEISLGVFVDDGAAGACKLSKAIAVTAHQVAGATVEQNKDVVKSYLTSGWTLEGAISGTNYRFTLANASGVTGKYRALGGYVQSDKPS